MPQRVIKGGQQLADDCKPRVASSCEVVNVYFEERLFGWIKLLHKITRTLEDHAIPYESVGGFAVTLLVEEVSPEHTRLPGRVDPYD